VTDVVDFTHAARVPARRVPLLLGQGLSLIGLAADMLVIVGISILTGVVYHLVAYGDPGDLLDFAKVGAVVALFRLIPHFQQHSAGYVTRWDREKLRYEYYLWNFSFLCLLALGFVAKISGTYSRGAIALFYLAGLPLFIAWQHVWLRVVQQAFNSGWVAMRRALLIGSPAKVVEFRRRYGSWGSGLIVAHTIMLPESTLEHSESGDESLNRALNEALQVIRNSRVDDVFVLIPWTAGHAINRAADVLSTSPISIHLAPEPVFDRFSDLRLSRLGTSKTLNLVRPPLNWLEIAEKRIFDIVLGTIALILVSPLLLIIAILIKLDSPGPVFFVQRRHGFNHKRFGILKFRSMTVTEDGAKVEQAKQNDPRVTRVGYYLRRWNLDELPQLINVIKGDMSLVGPRPHALTHNREYERQIAFYARRHNIKPGITGWAQVNGFRGITDTNHKMKARVEHDLYYIDNWSILFDLYILALTVLSPKARQNAY
jgi:Undecaprenyl-phosphate glucose phosphotransferase